MSCLDYPRVHFNGMFSTNVCTANNDDMNSVSNGGKIADKYYPIVDPVTSTLNPTLAAMTRDEVRAWFTDCAAGGGAPNAGWNYYGDHVVKFEGGTVSNVQTEPDGTDHPPSALLHSSVTLPGSPKMVDVDPTGSVDTQIFFGAFKVGSSNLGIEYSNQQDNGLVAYTRWIGPRNISVEGFASAAAT